ncbi:MAG: flagellar basal body protein, partial [Pseudolabrys sp.]
MQNALLVGLSRQVALQRELDVVANNIANLNTTGFKGDGAVFEEFIGPTARASGVPRADSRVSFVRDRATWIDL